MADADEAALAEPAAKPKPKPTSGKKTTGDFGLARPSPLPHLTSRPLSSLDDVTAKTKVDEYLSYSGRCSDTRSFTPSVDILDKYRSSKKTTAEEDNQRGRAHTGLTPPIDVNSSRYSECLERELIKSDPTLAQGYSKELADIDRNRSRTPLYTPKYTTYEEEESEWSPSVAPYRPPSAHVYDSIEPPRDYRPLGRESPAPSTTYRPITPDHITPQRVSSTYSRYDPIAVQAAMRPTSPGANSLGYDLDSMPPYLDRTPMSTLERPHKYKESTPVVSSFGPDQSYSYNNGKDQLTRENEILRKRVMEKEDEILALKREAGSNDFPVKDSYQAPRYNATLTIPSTTRAVTFKDSSYTSQAQEDPISKLAESNAAVLEKARLILSELDRVTTGGPNLTRPLTPVTSRPVAEPILNGDSFATTTSAIGTDWSRRVIGGMPKSVTNKYSAGSHPLEDRFERDYRQERFTSQSATPTPPPRNFADSRITTPDSFDYPIKYDREHQRRIDDVRAAIAAQSRKNDRVHRMITEIHDRQGHRVDSTSPLPASSAKFNSGRMSPSPIIDRARPPLGSARPVPVSPRQTWDTSYISNPNSSISCQVYDIDDERMGKGRSPRESPIDFTVQPEFYMPIKTEYMPQQQNWTAPPPPENNKDTSLAEFRRKTKELIERQRRISDKIYDKFQQLDIILPGSVSARNDRDAEDCNDGFYNSLKRGQTTQSAWGTQAPSSDFYNMSTSSGANYGSRENNSWKKLSLPPRPSFKRSVGFGRTPEPTHNGMPPLILECDKNGGWY